MAEIWKDIEGYEGIYQVSNRGRVKSLSRAIFNKHGKWMRDNPERIKKLTIGSHGYYVCSMHRGGQQTVRTIHTLVAEAFLTNDNSLRVVDHIDGNKLNCNLENLEYVDHKENNRRAYSTGLRRRNDGRAPWWDRLSVSQVDMIKECWQYNEKCGATKLNRPFTRAWLAKAFKLCEYEVKAIVR